MLSMPTDSVGVGKYLSMAYDVSFLAAPSTKAAGYSCHLLICLVMSDALLNFVTITPVWTHDDNLVAISVGTMLGVGVRKLERWGYNAVKRFDDRPILSCFGTDNECDRWANRYERKEKMAIYTLC